MRVSATSIASACDLLPHQARCRVKDWGEKIIQNASASHPLAAWIDFQMLHFVFPFYFSCKSVQPMCALLTAALRRTVRDLSFNPSDNSGGLKPSRLCLLERAVHARARLCAEGGWQEQRAAPSADGSQTHRHTGVGGK